MPLLCIVELQYGKRSTIISQSCLLSLAEEGIIQQIKQTENAKNPHVLALFYHLIFFSSLTNICL